MSEDEYNVAQWVRENHQNPFEVTDRILRLLIQRDEARAKLAQFDGKYNMEVLQAALDAEAARGYERGIREAAKVTERWLLADSYCTAEILALLEPASVG